MKLSIIIPVWQVEQTLGRCLESVMAQDFNDFEVILVDDGSPDNSPRLCDEWADKDQRIRVIHQQNKGLSAARNAGLDMAVGEFVTFIDSDDFMAQDTLSLLMPMTQECDLLEYPAYLHYGTKRQQYLGFEQQTYEDSDIYWTRTQAYLHSYMWNKIFRRSLFSEVRFPEGKVFEDVYTLPRLLHQKPRVMTTNKGAYYYCDNADGITATATGKELRMLLDAHLKANMPMDDRYYLYLLNIQMDVYELTGDEPRLMFRHVRPQGNMKQRTKAVALNLLGINRLCKTSKLLHCVKKPSRW